MSPGNEAGYRVRLAESRLRSAEDSAVAKRWADAALFARAAIENGAKAVLACFRTVPRTHEPSDIVRAALEDQAFPACLRDRAESLLPALGAYGLARHLQLTYGDEQNLRLPEELVGEGDARQSITDARAMVELAREVCSATLAQ
jgi:HEPN domain-containing protein